MTARRRTTRAAGAFGARGGGPTGVLPSDARQPRSHEGGGAGAESGRGDGDDGGEGRGWGPDGWSDDRPSDGRAELAFGFLLVAVVTLFVVFLGAWIVLRGNARVWPGESGAPGGLWGSTAIIALSSAVLARASELRRRERGSEARRWFAATLFLGCAFLVAQLFLWRSLVNAGLVPASGAYGTIFYALTGLHFAHVVGGLLYFAVVLRRPRIEWTHPTRVDRALRFSSLYWHLLTAIWFVLFAVLWGGA